MSELFPISPLIASAAASHDFPSFGQALFYLLGIVFFLLLNAFFVASEFAIVKVRPSQLETHGKETGADTARAVHVVKNLDGYLSANQLGITIASLALGFLGEPFVEAMISPLLFMMGMPEKASFIGLTFSPVSVISFVLAIASFTFLHVVVGELLPKSIAIRRSLGTTMLLVGPLHVFYKTFYLVIRFFQGTANMLLKNIFRIDPISEGEHVHSAEELAILVTHSGKFKEVTDTEREILINALELNELWVRDVMTPRNEVIVLDADEPFEKTLDIAIRSKHTRFPLVKGHLDQAIGLIHIKDLFKLMNDPDPDLMRIKRELKMVPDTMPLDSLLKFFLKEHAHLAMAVDEFGTPVGLVFLDNVMEELVGDIQDEFDNEHSSFIRVNDEEFVVEGSMTLNDLEGHVEELYLESGEVTTVGGYITQQLERFPEVGETLEILGYEAKVTSTDGRRVGQIHFRKLEEEEDNAESGEAEVEVA
ncbi:HlyC/CorC family transporter [Akkermansiaceae bacterium]|nr:HlyC/CorC family transporter [Akkermansiaceae bacterium]